MTDKEWWQRPIRMMRYDLSYDVSRARNLDLHRLAHLIRDEFHCNVDSVQAMPSIPPASEPEGGMGTVTFEAPGYRRYPGLEEWDWVRNWVPIAHEHGLKVVPYLNLHWFNYQFGQNHPEWLQRMADGRAYGDVFPLYGNGTTMCVNSAWREWAFGIIRSLARTGVDGAFLDGPVVFPHCCYCERCQSLFREQYGEDLPRSADWESSVWKQFIAFREDSLARFVTDARVAFRRVNPDGIVFCNAGTFRPGAYRVARDIERLQTSQDISGAEAFFHPGRADIPLHFSALTGKYERAGDLPGMVFLHHLYGPYHYVSLNPEEMGIAVSQAIATGSSVYFVSTKDALDNAPEETKAGLAPLAVQARHEELWVGAESGAEIAVLASSATLHHYVSRLEAIYREGGSAREEGLVADLAGKEHVDWEARKDVSDRIVTLAFDGWFSVLTRNHFQFDVLLDSKLTGENLQRYRLLILPNSACLSDQQLNAIEAFVGRGGALIASFESGVYDEFGVPRPHWPLGQLLGVKQLVGSFLASKTEEFTSLVSDNSVTAGLGVGRRLPRAHYAALVESDLPPTAVYYEPTGGLYRPLHTPSTRPSIVVQEDRHTVYFAEEIGHAYSVLKTPWHEVLMRNAILMALEGTPVVQTDGPATLEIELWRQASRLVLHLVNNSGDMQRPISQRRPLRNVSVSVVCEEPPLRAWRASDDSEVPSAWRDGLAVVRVPELDLYDAIVVDLPS